MANAIAGDTVPSPSAPIVVGKTPGRIKAAAWTAGVSALCVLAVVDDAPTWPVAVVAIGVVAMVAYVCHLILNYR
jgi:hypothetical protein